MIAKIVAVSVGDIHLWHKPPPFCAVFFDNWFEGILWQPTTRTIRIVSFGLTLLLPHGVNWTSSTLEGIYNRYNLQITQLCCQNSQQFCSVWDRKYQQTVNTPLAAASVSRQSNQISMSRMDHQNLQNGGTTRGGEMARAMPENQTLQMVRKQSVHSRYRAVCRLFELYH